MTWPGDAQTWMDVIDHLLVALAGIAVAAVPSWFAARNHRGIQEVRAENRVIRENVINGHPNPMRADMDAMDAKLNRVIENQARTESSIDNIRDEMRGGFAAMRGDMSEERNTRRAEDAAIRDEIRNQPG